MRGLSTVAAFAIFLTAFAVIIFSLFYFHSFLMSTAQKGVEAIRLATAPEEPASFDVASGKCLVGDGSGTYYVLLNSSGGVVYNGTSAQCPPPARGLYTYRAVRRDGGVWTARVWIGEVGIVPYLNVSSVVVDDYYRNFNLSLYVNIYNPSGGYAVVTNISASLGGGYISCERLPPKNLSRTLVVPPGGSAAVSVANFTCTVDVRRYIYRDGGPPSPIYVNVSAAYRGLVLVKKNAVVASVVARPAGRGYFNYTGDACVIGPVGASKPLYYVLLSGSNVLANGTSPQQLGDGVLAQCPSGRGYYTYRLVLSNGTVLSVPVAVDKLYVWAEANRTSAYVNQTARTVVFDLYLRFTNPAPGFAPLSYTYSLVYNTALLSCTMVAKPQYVTCTGGACTGTTALAPTETRALYVGTYRCDATDAFFKVNATTVAVSVSANYGSYVYFNGVVGRPSYSAPANWVVLRIEAGRAVYAPGASMVTLEQRRGLVSLIYARPPAPPPPTCPMFYLAANSSLYPLVSTSGLSLYKWVMPNWHEDYVVGTLFGPSPASLAKVSQSQNPPSYEIYLGPNLQLTPLQLLGLPTALPASVRWVTASGASYWVYANATALVGTRICTQPIANFTAKTMRSLASWTFSCPASTIRDGFNYCTWNSFGFDYQPQWLKFHKSSPGSQAYIDQSEGNPAPSLFLEGKNGYGAAYINITQWTGPVPAGNFSMDVQLQASLSGEDYVQLNFFIDLDGDGRPDLEVIHYSSGGGTTPARFSQTIYGSNLPYVTFYYSPNFPQKRFVTWTVTSYSTGFVVGVVIVVNSPNGDTKGYFDNIRITTKCALPQNVDVVKSGGSVTSVYISPSVSPTSAPSLATEVDASSGVGYAVARYWLSQRVPAAGTAVSVWGRYVRDAADAQNNAAFVAVGVDLDGDGVVDREYVYYMVDAASGQRYALVSSFISPGA
ncbi:MAG: hypothetical protein QXI84_10915, partial [Thermofilaceae archaeon]